MTTTRTASLAPVDVLRSDYQKSVATYWNNEKDPVNLRLGDVDELDLLVQRDHPRPVHLGPEMVFGVIAIVEPNQVVPFVIGTDPPGDWFVWIPAVVEKITVQVSAAVS